jgi:hypothetical protein
MPCNLVDLTQAAYSSAIMHDVQQQNAVSVAVPNNRLDNVVADAICRELCISLTASRDFRLSID